MRFRFCGDADCPDWVLAEMTTLSRLSSVKLKMLSTLVAQGLSNSSFDMEKAEKLFQESKLTGDSEPKRCIACLTFILRNSARFGCDAAALGGELQQLGLPREHAQAVKRVYTEYVDTLRTALRQHSFRVNQLHSVNFKSSSSLDLIETELKINENGEIRRILIPKTVFKTMLDDMKNVLHMMEDLATKDHVL